MRSQGRLRSFKVGIESKYTEQIESDGFWPEHIKCRKFVFHRSQQEYTRHNNINGFANGNRFLGPRFRRN